MAEDENPKRKKLSLHGNKKLSLGVGQDLIKSSRSASLTGTRSVQIETRRKRVTRKENIDQVFNLENTTNDKSLSNASGGLTDKEKQVRLNVLKHGLQDLDDKNKENKFLSKSEINKDEINENNDSNISPVKQKLQIIENPSIQPTSKEVNNFDRSKKQNDAKPLNDEAEAKKERQKLKITVRRDEPRRRAGKITITDAVSGQESRMRSLSSIRRQREKVKIQTESIQQVKQYRDVVIPDSITVGELAIRMSEKTADVVKEFSSDANQHAIEANSSTFTNLFLGILESI